MKFSKGTMICLFLAVLCCLAVSSAAYPLNIDEPPKGKTNSVQSPVSIPAVEEKEVMVVEEGLYKPFVWGNDATIGEGSVQGGISVAYDSNFTQYAVRCTTNTVGEPQKGLRIYKSTDYGATWQPFKWIVSSYYEFSYPQLQVCEFDPYKYLYVFYLNDYLEGQIKLYRCTLDGSSGVFYTVADRPAGDTITYYSTCTNISGSSISVVYEVHESGDVTPDVRSVRSVDRGATWIDDILVDSDGQHTDVAYGYAGYTYLVYGTTNGGVFDIEFRRSTNWGESWGSSVKLMADSYDDDYPKVAAIHTTSYTAANVWVTFSHNYGNTGDWNVRYVYSTNSGTNWSSYKKLAYSTDYDEIAADLVCWRFYEYPFVHVSYIKYKYSPIVWTADIYTAWSNNTDPTNWQDLTKINDQRSSYAEDARKVCQGSIMPCFIVALAGYVYTGSTKAPASYNNLYWDGYCFTDVEEEEDQQEPPSEFSLHDNYPNPFNPETRIRYTVGTSGFSHVRLQVFNVLGQRVKTLVDDSQAPGTYEVTWDGNDENGGEAASGIYFYKLEANQFNQTKKMILIR